MRHIIYLIMSDFSAIISNDSRNKLTNYLTNNKNTKICVLTPCFGDICHVGYIKSLLNTIQVFEKLKIDIHVEFCRNDSLVTRARNNLIAKAMNDKSITHFLFIDNDISWNPEDIVKLLYHDKHIIGGVYPIKKYNWHKLLTQNSDTNNYDSIHKMKHHKDNSMISNLITDEDYIRSRLVDYNLNYLDGRINITNNIAKVKHVATGFMMIKRTTIEKMITAFPSTKYTDDVNFLTPDENKYAYALFDCCIENNSYYSEDWLFCNRWINMGGNIFIDITICLEHTGLEDYKGAYITSIV
jgi:hypothetical protein